MKNSEKMRLTIAIDAIIAACRKELGLHKTDGDYWETNECHEAENQIFESAKNNIFDHEADQDFSDYMIKATPTERLEKMIEKLEEIKTTLK